MNYVQEQAFNTAVKLLRDGESTLTICDALEGECLGLNVLEIRQTVSQAATYVKELQEKSFKAAVEAFQHGETILEVERKLRQLGFSPWDAMTVASRAQQKAQTTDTPKPETSEAVDVVDADVFQRREDESRLAALEKLSRTNYPVPKN